MTRWTMAFFAVAAFALAPYGCESIPTLTFAEAGAPYDASDATADAAEEVDCPAADGGTVLCKGSCTGACPACTALCMSEQLCCANKNGGVVCKNAGAACP